MFIIFFQEFTIAIIIVIIAIFTITVHSIIASVPTATLNHNRRETTDENV